VSRGKRGIDRGKLGSDLNIRYFSQGEDMP
jgi:hypothetical protein